MTVSDNTLYMWIVFGGLLLGLVSILSFAWAVGAFDEEQTCSEYGTVMVTVDGTSRCVPWEQVPDIQDFPQP